MQETKRYHVAIVGATTVLGHECLKILEQRRFPIASLRLFAADKTGGKKIFIGHREVEVHEPNSQSFDYVNIAFFLGGTETSLHYAPVAVRAGALVIDASAAFRLEPWVPLVVPEVNPEELKKRQGIIAVPNNCVIPLVMVLQPLRKQNPIKRVVVATFQSVSGSSSQAMEELTTQTKLVLEGKSTVPHIFPHQIAFNLLPEVDVFLDNGYTREEWKIVQETRKIMRSEDLRMAATAVRVPIYVGHSEAVHIEFANPITPADARRILAEAPGIKVQDDPSISLYPQPWAVAGTDEVFVGRVRQDMSCDNGLILWVVSDNTRKGAALNAVQIAEEIIRHGLVP